MNQMEETDKEVVERHSREATSIAVIEQKLADFRELMFAKLNNQDDILKRIEQQTLKTNGSVAKTIEDINNINYWRNKIVGGLLVSNAIVLPLLLWLVYNHLEK